MRDAAPVRVRRSPPSCPSTPAGRLDRRRVRAPNPASARGRGCEDGAHDRPTHRPRARRWRHHRHRVGDRSRGRPGRAGRRSRRRRLVVGTSAGSVVGARLATGEDLGEMYARHWSPRRRSGPSASTVRAWPSSAGRCCAAADGTSSSAAGSVRWPSPRRRPASPRRSRSGWTSSAPILGGREWPERALTITAVDAETGEFRAFDRDLRCPPPLGGRGELRGSRRLSAGDDRGTPVRRRGHAVGGQRRPRPRLRAARRPGPDRARLRSDRQRRRPGHRHGQPRRRRLPGRGQPDGDRATC